MDSYLLTTKYKTMKRQIIYLLMGVLGTIGLNSCGPTQGTNDTNRTAPGTETTTGTTGTTGDMSGTTTGTTGDPTATTTGTTGDMSGTTTGTTGDPTATTTGTTGDMTSTTGDPTMTNRTTTSTTQDDYSTGNMQDRNDFELSETTDYTYGSDNYRFTPDSRGINIIRIQEGQESPYGTMRSIGDEGYFMITTTDYTTGEEEVSVGRFDEEGHLTVYRYDRDLDDVSEENFRSANPQNNTTNQNRGGIIDPGNNN